MGDATIDARMQAALARLTDNEKECLRRRLQQQTAKEMALELGVSPHAVEKRLKMARTKLGLSSSLEAARLLAASEGYQREVPHVSDLDRRTGGKRLPAGRFWLAGGIIMTLIMATLLAVALQPSEQARDPGDDVDLMSPEFIAGILGQNFEVMDQDRSGFLEPLEIPAAAEAERRAAIAAGDKNADGKLDLAEYRDWLAPIVAERAAAGRKAVDEYFARTSD